MEFISKTIGFAQLYHADCNEVLKTLPEKSVDFIVTDPPYECTKTVVHRHDCKDLDSNFGEWDKFSTDWIPLAEKTLKDDSGMIIFMPSQRIETLIDCCAKVGLKYVQTWYFYKTNPPPVVRNCLQWAVEPMIYVKKGKHQLRIENKGLCHNLFTYPYTTNKIHPTQKPVDLMVKIIKYISDPEHTILDPFSGSGTTGVAAVSNGRKYIGIEQDADFFKKSCNRLKMEVEFA